MATMIPAMPSDATRSNAEKDLFRRFRRCSGEWTVIHSVGLAHHERKPWAEADFVIVGNAGVLVCEVKGGVIRRKDGVWKTNKDTLSHSPFDQAGGAAAALRSSLLERVEGLEKGVVGYCVMFPDCIFDETGPDIERQLVFDAKLADKPIEDWIDGVFEYWRNRIGDMRRGNRPPGLSKKSEAAAVAEIAKDFDCVPSMKVHLGELEEELIRLTDQQADAVAGLRGNRRVLVEGGAGTGKTLIAQREALDRASRGDSVLYTCFSRALAAEAGLLFADVPGVTVRHFHGLTMDLITQAGLGAELQDAERFHETEEFFGVDHPRLALEAMTAADDPKVFDVVVVDEAQDLSTGPSFDLLDALVKGGLKEGEWRVFRDLAQNIFDQVDDDAERMLTAGAPTTFRLSNNCRNTQNIAIQTAILSRRLLEETTAFDGPKVDYFEFDDLDEKLDAIVETLTTWFGDGLAREDVVLIGHESLEGLAGLSSGMAKRGFKLSDSGRSDDSRIRYSTVAGFKGLESSAVVFVDIGDLAADWVAKNLYVGLSRAKFLLAIGAPVDSAADRERLLVDYGERMAPLAASTRLPRKLG